mgnify:CR=1 FL=1
MKRTWLTALTVCFAASGLLLAAGPTKSSKAKWETKFEKAKEQAEEKGLPILADFTGSDWCGWCIKLDEEVFSQKEFKEYASENLVLFMADYPRAKKQSASEKKQNEELAQKYSIQGFPTILLLDAEGEVLARTGYQPGGAEKYVEHIKKLIEENVKTEEEE